VPMALALTPLLIVPATIRFNRSRDGAAA
jgi:hypothetical protein